VPRQGEQVLMLRQYRPALDETILELPAGTRERAEPWLECAQRELREETGYRAAQFTSLGYIWPAPGLSSEVMAIYLATGLTPDPLPADFDEQFELVPMPLVDLLEMARDGRLQDAKSVIALLRTQAWGKDKK
jgi:ADP-ribose pyrophosphatase